MYIYMIYLFFGNIINRFIVSFNQFNAFLVNKSINLKKSINKKNTYWPQT